MNFHFEVFAISEPVGLLDQLSDFVIKPFHTCIADMSKRPETDNPIEFIPNGMGYSS